MPDAFTCAILGVWSTFMTCGSFKIILTLSYDQYIARWALLLHNVYKKSSHLRAVIARAGPENIVGLSVQLYEKDCQNILLF